MVGAGYGYGGVCGFMAGQVRVIMRRGQLTGQGTSTAADLVYALSTCFQLAAHELDLAVTQLRAELQTSLARNAPAIVLGHWDGPLHWVVVAAVNEEGVVVLDPAGGLVKNLDWQQVQLLYAGASVCLDLPMP